MWDKTFFMWLAIWVCLSEMKAAITMPHPSRKSMHFWKPRNSIAGLLPAWFLWKQNGKRQVKTWSWICVLLQLVQSFLMFRHWEVMVLTGKQNTKPNATKGKQYKLTMRNLVILYHIYFCIYTTIYHAPVVLDSLCTHNYYSISTSHSRHPTSMMSMKKIIQEIGLPVQVQNEWCGVMCNRRLCKHNTWHNGPYCRGAHHLIVWSLPYSLAEIIGLFGISSKTSVQ